MNSRFESQLGKGFLLWATIAFFYALVSRFYAIAWGTGNLIGEFSPKWAVGLILFAALLLFCSPCSGFFFGSRTNLRPLQPF